jgi:hypothetical protein
MALIAQYHRLRADAGAPADVLDDRTWADLDLDAVFAGLDRTHSTIGQQVLYDRLRSAPRPRHLDAFEALVQCLEHDAGPARRIREALRRLGDPAGYQLCALTAEGLPARRWHAVFPVLTVAMVVALLLVPVSPAAILAAVVIGAINVAVRLYMTGPAGLSLSVFRQVGPLIAAADAVAAVRWPGAHPLLAPLERAVPRLRRLRFWSGWSGQLSGNELLASLREYLNLLFLLDANALFFGGRELRRSADALLDAIDVVGAVDAALAVGAFRGATPRWTRPRFDGPDASVVVDDVRHPLLAAAVPNSIAVRPPDGLLLTGANMSGKSTFLRTLGVNVVLAQTLHTCLASAYRAPVLKVRTLMGHADGLVAGRSYYLSEVLGAIELVRASETGEPHLFLLDELFRGTNASERIAAAAAVLEHLARVRDGGRHLVVAATHDGELNDILAAWYAPFHFGDRFGAAGLEFDYRLTPGPATTRNAIRLLAANGAPDGLVHRAQGLADAFDVDGRGRRGQSLET